MNSSSLQMGLFVEDTQKRCKSMSVCLNLRFWTRAKCPDLSLNSVSLPLPPERLRGTLGDESSVCFSHLGQSYLIIVSRDVFRCSVIDRMRLSNLFSSMLPPALSIFLSYSINSAYLATVPCCLGTRYRLNVYSWTVDMGFMHLPIAVIPHFFSLSRCQARGSIFHASIHTSG